MHATWDEECCQFFGCGASATSLLTPHSSQRSILPQASTAVAATTVKKFRALCGSKTFVLYSQQLGNGVSTKPDECSPQIYCLEPISIILPPTQVRPLQTRQPKRRYTARHSHAYYTPRPSHIICSPLSFIALETKQYYNFVFYNIYVL